MRLSDLSGRQMGKEKTLGLGRLEADPLAVAPAPRWEGSSPVASVQRDIANSALLSLDQYPGGSNPEQDTRQWLESERQGPVGWGGVT